MSVVSGLFEVSYVLYMVHARRAGAGATDSSYIYVGQMAEFWRDNLNKHQKKKFN